jgi:hypothetical protein
MWRPRKPAQSATVRALGAVSALALVALLGSSGCAQRGPAPGAYGPPQPPVGYPSPRVYAYPEHGQSPARQDRDRYECYEWAVRQSRYDPSLAQPAPVQQVRVISTRPPIADTFSGAAVGALVGGAATYSSEGAAIGAAIGATAGAISDLYREHGRRELERSLESRPPPGPGGRADDYRRALSACLEGRGYSVG